MPVDIRATVTCSLGTLISGSISDDYLQENGLLRTRGSAEISGTITPAIGTIVTFSYVKGNTTRTIPRKLRVLSSFADPYRRTTQVELGCKLTYLSDLKDPIDWSVFDDPNNSTYNENDSKTVPLPIRASSVMDKCLAELGITASSSPLTNVFSVGEFDFSPGYVQVLSDLLVSESYFGYLDINEVLQIVNLAEEGGTGPVYTANELADLGPINSGQLPGEAVTVSYSSLRLKKAPPTEEEDRDILNWEVNKVVNGPVRYYIGDRVYTGMETTRTEIQYKTINGRDVPVVRSTVETGSTAKVAGSIGTSYVNNNIDFIASRQVLRREVENSFYDKEGNLTRTEVKVLENPIAFYGSLSLEYAFAENDFVSFPSSGFIDRERIITTYSGSQKSDSPQTDQAQLQVTTTSLAWVLTIPGQQAIAENRDSFENADQVRNYVRNVVSAGLVLDRSVSQINRRNITSARPKNVAALELKEDVISDNSAQIEVALGSAAAQRRIEFSLPYAADDTGTGPPGGPYSIKSNQKLARETANRYGRVQNRLLLGNRSGMNIQLSPERLPAAPFAPMYIQANGLTAQYRANGNQWAFSAEGIVCSTDALFWAAVGGTGTFWFPVAPGVTTLPTTPATVDGTITPTVTLPPYNEVAVYIATVKTAVDLINFAYPLQVTTEIPPITIKTKLIALREFISAEAGTYTIDGKAATAFAGYLLLPSAGAYVWSGNDARLADEP